MELNLENYTRLKAQSKTRAQIAEIFDMPEWKLKKFIATNNWGKSTPLIKYPDAFAEVTPESCYWGGFLAADGCVDNKNRVRLTLKHDDVRHIEKFMAFVGSNHKLMENTTPPYNKAGVEFVCSQMVEDLDLNFNIIPNKSLMLEFPSLLSTGMLRHYIRGFFDGDGSVCESFSNVASITATTYATFTSGSKKFIDELFEHLHQVLRLGGHLQAFKDSQKFQIKYNTNDANTLLTYLYEDASVYLERKFQLYQRIVVDNNRLKR